MDLPNKTNGENIAKNLFVLLSILILIGLIVSAFFLWRQSISKKKLLVANISPEEAIQIIYSAPGEDPFSTPHLPSEPLPSGSEEPLFSPEALELTEEIGILAVSTGEVSNSVLESNGGKKLADATTLEVLTVDSNGKIKTLYIVLQIFPTYDSEKNITPWFVEHAVSIRSLTMTFDSSSLLSEEQVRTIFPRGSLWIFKPILDLDSPFLSKELKEEYAPLAREYYGDDLPFLVHYLNNGLRTRYNRKPLLLIGINPIY